ncbi:MAG TPA: hypothetical protein VE422_30855 [Terriglobia bacterium]|nr:hypothetical protein [Terriglobia bacterium]
MTDLRWKLEIRKMATAFPEFEAFWRGGHVGFTGELRSRNGRTFEVTIEVSARRYPSRQPSIFISPQIGSNWLSDGSLCVNSAWIPERSTFAQQVSYAASYIARHG